MQTQEYEIAATIHLIRHPSGKARLEALVYTDRITRFVKLHSELQQAGVRPRRNRLPDLPREADIDTLLRQCRSDLITFVYAGAEHAEQSIDNGSSRTAPPMETSEPGAETPPPVEHGTPRPPKGKRGVVMTGKLLRFGERMRQLDDRTFLHYFITLACGETRTEETLWGKDLERALTVSGAKQGDRIKVQSLGLAPVQTESGSSRIMKRYAITQLNSFQQS